MTRPAMFVLLLLTSARWTGSLASVEEMEAPTNLEAGDHSTSSFKVTWDHADSAESSVEYRVDQREGRLGEAEVGPWLERIHVAEAPVHYLTNTDKTAFYDVRVKALRRGPDGRLLAQSPWSDVLRVETTTGRDTGRSLTLDAPRNLRWLALEPNSIAVKWDVGGAFRSSVYYRLLSRKEGGGPWSEYRAEVQSPRLSVGQLDPGATYHFRLQAREDPAKASVFSPVLVAKLPQESEFFRVRGLKVRAQLSGFRSDAVLNWTVPDNFRSQIRGFNVTWKYFVGEELQRGHKWLSGPATGVVLEDTKDRTQYRILVNAHLNNGITVESQEFVINTKAPEPIGKLDVLYRGKASEVGLSWELNPSLDTSLVRGYNLEFAKEADKDSATGWRRLVVDGAAPNATMRHLSPDTTYFLRISPLHRDGSIMPSHSNFRFKTLAEEEPLDLGVQIASPNDTAVQLRWSYPSGLAGRVAGALVLYSRNRQADFDSWQRVSVPSATVTQWTLVSLRPRATYFVWIRPRLTDGTLYQEGRRPLIFRVKAGAERKRSTKLCLDACASAGDCPAGFACMRSSTVATGGAWCVPQGLQEL